MATKFIVPLQKLIKIFNLEVLYLPKEAGDISISSPERVTRGASSTFSSAIRAARKDEVPSEVRSSATSDASKVYDRMGMNDEYTDVLGIQIPSLTIPVKPGRNIAIIIEVAAMNNRGSPAAARPHHQQSTGARA